MRKANLLTFLALIALGTITMHGQTTRTWVSAFGDDANPCSRTAPCKTFAAAMAQTVAGGEIDALDPGSFGSVTITKALTIDGGGSQIASVLAAGTNGIVVQAGASDTVILRNLRLNGVRGSSNPDSAATQDTLLLLDVTPLGINGIRYLSGGSLIVDKCEIFGFSNNGIDIALGSFGAVWVTNTNIQNIGGVGVRATTTTSVVIVEIDNVRIESANKGIESADHSRVIVTNSSAIWTATAGFQADGDAVITVNHSVSAFNAAGVQTGGIGGGSPQAWVSDSDIVANSTGFLQSLGTISTFGNNRMHDNSSNGTLNLPQVTH